MVLSNTVQQVGKATIAVEFRKKDSIEDSSRCYRAGDSGRRYRFGGLSASGSL